jgi:hypothetical protein
MISMDAFIAQTFEVVAQAQAARFADGARCRIRDHGTVHAVRTQRWFGDIEVPSPDCGIGISGFDLAALEPTTAPLTCLRCIRRQEGGLEATGQLALFPEQRAA